MLNRLTISLATLGMVVSGYLIYHHYAGVSVPCGGSAGCDTVLESSYATLFGSDIPTAAAGFLMYLLIAAGSFIRITAKPDTAKKISRAILAIIFVGLVISAYFFYVQKAILKAFCPFCLSSALIVLLLFIVNLPTLAKSKRKQAVPTGEIERSLIFFFGALVLGAVLIASVASIGTSPPPKLADEHEGAAPQTGQLIRSYSHMEGSKDAKVTVVEFFDYQCPLCHKAHQKEKELLEKYPGQVRFVYRHYPIYTHANAFLAARAAEAADLQGAFLKMHDKIMKTPTDKITEASLQRDAADIGLNIEKFNQDLNAPEVISRVEQDIKDCRALIGEAPTTPWFFINRESKMSLTPDELELAVVAEIKRQAE